MDKVWRALANLIGLGKVSKEKEKSLVVGFGQEERTLLKISPSGLVHAEKGNESEALALFPYGKRSNGMALAVNLGNLPVELKPGETITFASSGEYILLGEKKITVNADAVELSKDLKTAGDIVAEGDVSDSVGSLNELRERFNKLEEHYSSHTHTGNLSAPTTAPIPTYIKA